MSIESLQLHAWMVPIDAPPHQAGDILDVASMRCGYIHTMTDRASMYLPQHFVGSAAQGRELMVAYPFASLISLDERSAPFVTHLPLHLEAKGDDPTEWVLWGHFAKNNPHWKMIDDRAAVVVTFLGPDAYMSPSVYNDRARVPTWNYVTVHAQGHARLVVDKDAKDALLKRLINDHEPTYRQQWIDLGREFQERMLDGIVGFSIAIQRLEVKVKVNQHRPEAHARMHELYDHGSPSEQKLAMWLQRVTTNPYPA
jgi:transcriptional regulator